MLPLQSHPVAFNAMHVHTAVTQWLRLTFDKDNDLIRADVRLRGNFIGKRAWSLRFQKLHVRLMLQMSAAM